MPRRTKRNSVRASSGNVFEDIGLPRAQEAFAKAELARHIAAIISKKGLTQAKASTLLGIDQPKVSALLRGRLSGFSTDRLIRFVTALGKDVEIAIKPKATGRRLGQVRVLGRASASAR
jgi:predicted XRE-type DNA-binding protein